MDYGRMQELLLDVQHRHSDGSWGRLEPEASHDPSRTIRNGSGRTRRSSAARPARRRSASGRIAEPGGHH